MGAMASQISTIVYSTVYSGADQRKHQSSESLAFVRKIQRWPVNSPHKWPVTRKIFPFDNVIMLCFISITFYTHGISIMLSISSRKIHNQLLGSRSTGCLRRNQNNLFMIFLKHITCVIVLTAINISSSQRIANSSIRKPICQSSRQTPTHSTRIGSRLLANAIFFRL